MLTILNNVSRNLIRTSLINTSVQTISLQRVSFSDDIKAEDISIKTETKTLSGFAKAFEKFEKTGNVTEPKPEDTATFHSLLRNSKFIDVNVGLSRNSNSLIEIFFRWEIRLTKLLLGRYIT